MLNGHWPLVLGGFSLYNLTDWSFTALPMIHDYIADVDQDLQVDMDSGDEDNPKMEVTAA